METTRIMTIGNQRVEVKEIELPQSQLLFFPENPRVYNALHGIVGDNPSQEEIQRHMQLLDNVKVLKLSIEANGGLLEPIIVRKNIVLEGNCRLAAYRLLAQKDPIKWGKIKANVMPDDTPEELVVALLGTIHIIGKTPWTPFEQAAYLARAINKTRKPIDALANELGMQKASAQAFIRVYQAMVEADDANPHKWSYYFELDKRNDIKEADANNPALNLMTTIKDMIKDDKIEKAQDLRDIGKIVKAKGENAAQALEEFLNEEISLSDAVELAREDTKLASIQKKVEAFLDFLKKEQGNIARNKSDVELNYTIKQIRTILSMTMGLGRE